MIEITVKTLDSQNHAFSVPDDVTVRQFKEKIFETLPIPIDSQRLIYCGRVLQDDKKLNEYDVNGKVVHLVQRAPPQSSPTTSAGTGTSNGTGTRSGNWTRRGSNRRTAFRSRLDGGNAMYLGAMAIPADVMDASGITTPPPSQSLSRSRLATARRMIRGATILIDALEGQASTDPVTPDEPGGSSSESNGEQSTVPQEGEDGASQPMLGESMSEFSQAATAAVIASAFSAARTSGVPSHMTISRRSRGREEVSLSVDVDSHGNITHVSGENTAEAAGVDGGAEGESPPPEPAANQDEAGPSRGVGNRRVRDYHTRTPALADVMEELSQVNQRLQPYLQRYQELVRTDPDFGSDANEGTVANRLYFKVSQVMHYLSHAYHALSDIMCDFTQPPPRSLRCRPVLIQHSAVLQAGIPISAQINVMTNRGTSATMPAPAASSTPPDGSSPEPTSQVSSSTGQESRETPTGAQVLEGLGIDSSFVSGVVLELQTQEREIPVSTTTLGSSTPAHQPTARDSSAPTRPVAHVQPTIASMPSSFNLPPGNVEFFMEVGPGSITIDSVEATLLPPLSNSTGSGTTDTGVTGHVPWGSAPPPEFIQNLMQAVAGHMIRGNMGPQEASTPPAQPSTTASQGASSTSAAPNAANAAGQNSQARGNTATHPTTSTQTRSTSRPHVHLASPMGGFGTGTFDQFLPCNSHHVRSFRRRGPMHVYHHMENDGGDVERGPREPRSRATHQHNLSSAGPTDGNPIAQLFSGLMSNLQPTASTPNQPQAAQGAAPTPSAPPRQPNINIANIIRGLMDNLTQTTRRAGVTLTAPSVSLPAGLLTQILEGMERPIIDGTSHSLADFMQSYFTDMGDRSYNEGESLLEDLVMVLARNLTLQDVMNVSIGQGAPLDSVRTPLREFIRQRVLQGGDPSSPQDVSRGIDRLNREFRPYLDVVLQARLREDIDLILTFNKFNQVRFSELIRHVMSDDQYFGTRLMVWFQHYMKEMFTILLHCCNDDIQCLEGITQSYVRQLTSGLSTSVQEWTIASSVTHMRAYVASLNIPISNVQDFIVYRALQAMPEPTIVPAASPIVVTASVQAEEPMELDSPPAIEPFAPSEKPDDIPTASLTVEPWHTAVPSDWVPLITRDVQRQRRQSSQAPFSDAYLAGMPSKRRKVITAGKPNANINQTATISQAISHGVRRAISAAGVPPPRAAGPESISQLISTDASVQDAYRTQVRNTISNRLHDDPDYSEERFPNADKIFGKK